MLSHIGNPKAVDITGLKLQSLLGCIFWREVLVKLLEAVVNLREKSSVGSPPQIIEQDSIEIDHVLRASADDAVDLLGWDVENQSQQLSDAIQSYLPAAFQLDIVLVLPEHSP